MVIIYLNLCCAAITLLVNQWEMRGIVGKFSPPDKSLSSPVIHPLARLFFITEKLQRHDLFFWWPDKEQSQKTTTFELSGEICGWDFLILVYLLVYSVYLMYTPNKIAESTQITWQSFLLASQNSSHFHHMHIPNIHSMWSDFLTALICG